MITVKEVDRTYFDKKQGAVLSKVDMYAYYSQPDSRDEIQFIMYLDL